MGESSLSATSQAAAIEALRHCASVEAAYLLGSAAAGSLRPDSDVDIAVLPRHATGVAVEDRLALTTELTAIFRREVDLGVLSTANLVYAKEAIATGSLLFERDHRVTATFAMVALSMYASLQETRREVLRAYAA